EEAIAAMALEQVLPRDSSGSFEDVFANMSPFDSPQINDKKLNASLQANLARIISKIRGVADATVFIDPTHERQLEGSIEPKASVYVRMRNGTAADKKLAEAIAELVAGTNGSMKRSRVSIIIDGVVWAVKDRDPNAPSGEIDEQQANAEKRNADKIQQALRPYGEVIAVVTAKIDTITSQTNSITHTNVISKP